MNRKLNICQTCLSADRNLYPLQLLRHLLFELDMEEIKELKGGVCWECRSNMRKFLQFKEKVRKAQDTICVLKFKQIKQFNSLSTLVTSHKSDYDFEYEYMSPQVMQEDEHVYIKQETETYENDSDEEIPLTQNVNIYIEAKYTEDEENSSLSEDVSRDDSSKECVDESRKYEKVVMTEEDIKNMWSLKRSDQDFQKMTFKCLDCVIGFNSSKSYEAHVRKKHDECAGPFCCALCKVRFPTEFQLNKHAMFHYRCYKCKLCDFKSSVLNSVLLHYSMAHCADAKGIQCKKCQLVVDTLEQLNEHTNKMHKLDCNLCEKRFKGKSSLREHKNTYVIVTWKDHTENCINTSVLKPVEKNVTISLGTEVKRLSKSKWYHGTVTAVVDDTGEIKTCALERSESEDSEDLEDKDLPTTFANESDDTEIESQEESDNDMTSCSSDQSDLSEDMDLDPNYQPERSFSQTILTDSQETTVNRSKIENIVGKNVVESYNDDFSAQKNVVQSLSVNTSPRFSLEEMESLSIHKDEEYRPQTCEVPYCSGQVFSSCFRCTILLCWQHFEKDYSCDIHSKGELCNKNSDASSVNNSDILYSCEGSKRECNLSKKKCVNKRKMAKILRDSGQEYIALHSKKLKPAKVVGECCNVEKCRQMRRHCYRFKDDVRKNILAHFYRGDLYVKRDFIVKHVTECEPKQRTVKGKSKVSRRQITLKYYLSYGGEKYRVCRKTFFNTLAVSEKFVRNALTLNKSGKSLRQEKRGGRVESLKKRDEEFKMIVKEHINSFPRVVLNYCQCYPKKEYLDSNLSVNKMHSLLLDENKSRKDIPGIAIYKKIFNSMNLDFYRPENVQCSHCADYYNGTPLYIEN